MHRARLSGWLASMVSVAALVACAGGPQPPGWQVDAKAAIDQAVAAYLAGDARGEAAAFERAREQISRTGRPDWLARAELMRCAAHVASLAFEPCTGFERLRGDADAAERAYADHLAARRLTKEDIERLPAAQRGVAQAVAGGDATSVDLQGIDDPLSRLIAVAVLFQAGKASPAAVTLAADTASAQGWRRPLLAWLEVLALRAEKAGAVGEAERLRRRMDLVGLVGVRSPISPNPSPPAPPAPAR